MRFSQPQNYRVTAVTPVQQNFLLFHSALSHVHNSHWVHYFHTFPRSSAPMSPDVLVLTWNFLPIFASWYFSRKCYLIHPIYLIPTQEIQYRHFPKNGDSNPASKFISLFVLVGVLNLGTLQISRFLDTKDYYTLRRNRTSYQDTKISLGTSKINFISVYPQINQRPTSVTVDLSATCYLRWHNLY